MYHREFGVIAKSLEKRKSLSGYDQDDYFWSGIQPKGLWEILEVELKSKTYWKNVMEPLPMNKVIEVALKYLDSKAYHPQDDSLRSKLKSQKKKRSVSEVEESTESSSEDGMESGSESELSESEKDELVVKSICLCCELLLLMP